MGYMEWSVSWAVESRRVHLPLEVVVAVPAELVAVCEEYPEWVLSSPCCETC